MVNYVPTSKYCCIYEIIDKVVFIGKYSRILIQISYYRSHQYDTHCMLIIKTEKHQNAQQISYSEQEYIK